MVVTPGPTEKTFRVDLKCGCAASYVHAQDVTRAVEILFGGQPPKAAKSVRIVELRKASEIDRVRKELALAGPARWVCRGFCKPGGKK